MNRSASIEALREELVALERAEREAAFAARKCRVCGEPDEEYDGEKGYLTEFELSIAPGEEGHSVIQNSYLCEEDLENVCNALIGAGVAIHYHGSTCFLEPHDCPGYSNSEACPTPDNQED